MKEQNQNTIHNGIASRKFKSEFRFIDNHTIIIMKVIFLHLFPFF